MGLFLDFQLPCICQTQIHPPNWWDFCACVNSVFLFRGIKFRIKFDGVALCIISLAPNRCLGPTLYSSLVFYTLLYSSILFWTLLYSSEVFYTLLFSTLLYSTLFLPTLASSSLHHSTLHVAIEHLSFSMGAVYQFIINNLSTGHFP